MKNEHIDLIWMRNRAIAYEEFYRKPISIEQAFFEVNGITIEDAEKYYKMKKALE
jgi:hypothetical protein